MKSAHAIVALLALTTACHRSKDMVEEPPPPPPVEETQAMETVPIITGTLSSAHSAEGCAWLVLVDREFSHPANGGEATVPEMLIPIALEEQYLKDGQRLRFTYRLSRAHNGGCTQGTPAILENVTVLPQKSARPSGINAPVDR